MDPQYDANGFRVLSASSSPLMNPPPQIFGAYSSDGQPLAANVTDMAGPMYFDEILLGDSNEAKRQRIARACDMCRKKKIKCDGKMPCTHCSNYKTECILTQVEKKRSLLKGAKYIEGLENRLGRMENLLRLSGLLNEDDNGRTDLGTLEGRLAENKKQSESRKSAFAIAGSNTTPPSQSSLNEVTESTPRSTLDSPFSKGGNSEECKPKNGDVPEKTDEERVEDLSDMMCSLVTNNCGETRYIGSSSGFSIFSPRGIQWVNSKTGDMSFQDSIFSSAVDDNKWMYWKPEVFGDVFTRRVFKQLPPKHETLSLLKDFFENLNCIFPLFHQPTFMHLVDREYSNDRYEGSGWWASLNVVLAIAYRLRVMSHVVPAEEDESAWKYLKNSMAVFTELTIRNTDLLSIQALVGMALFFMGTPSPQPNFFLVAAAIRASHGIGLHKRGSGFNLNPAEIEQRKRVFWIAYLLDKDICLRSGRPSSQDDDDMNLELPSTNPEDNIGNIPLADGKGTANLFRLMCEFAVIQSKVYKQLYSTTASKQSDGELLNSIGELDRQLEEWKDSIPIDYRPEYEIKASHTPLILHVVVLHFAYYNCLTTIHRMSVRHGYWTSRLSNYAIQGLNTTPLNPRVFSSAALCVSAARASIHLMRYLPQGDSACVWMVLYYPISALTVLFGNILQNPQDPRAPSDLQLMKIVVDFLSMLNADQENGGVRRMLGVCAEFERIANVVLEKAKEGPRRKRKSPEEPKIKSSVQNSAAMPQTLKMQSGPTPMAPGISSDMWNTMNSQHGPNPVDHEGSLSSGQWLNDFTNGNEFLTPSGPGGMTPFSDMLGFTTAMESTPSSLNFNTFQQPFFPQNLWQMPMNVEWDWANMSGIPYPRYENGSVNQTDLHDKESL